MKGENGILIVVVGLVILWLGITGKFDCWAGTFNCMMGRAEGSEGAASPNTASVAPSGGALDRVASRLGQPYRLPSLDAVLAGTPPFV